MVKDRKAFCLIALFLGLIEFLIILFAPSFFMIVVDGNSGIITSKVYSFGESFQLVRSYGLLGIFCSLIGIVFIIAIIIGMANNLLMFFAKEYSSNIATVCYSISLAISIIYPIIIALKMGNTMRFACAEFGYVSFILLILISVFSRKGRCEENEKEFDQYETGDECDDSCSEEE